MVSDRELFERRTTRRDRANVYRLYGGHKISCVCLHCRIADAWSLGYGDEDPAPVSVQDWDDECDCWRCIAFLAPSDDVDEID